MTINAKLKAQHFFMMVTAKPKTVMMLGLMIIAVFASFIPGLQKDTRSDAFIPSDHPALIFRKQTEKIFGLQDPLVVAVINEDEKGVFNPHTLFLVDWLTTQISAVTQIDPARVTSLATENNILGTSVRPAWA
jgi:predicted RND superfamily exporter protein